MGQSIFPGGLMDGRRYRSWAALGAVLLGGCATTQQELDCHSPQALARLQQAMAAAPEREQARATLARWEVEAQQGWPRPQQRKALPTATELARFDRSGPDRDGAQRTARVAGQIKPDGHCTLSYSGHIEPALAAGFFDAARWLLQYPCTQTLVKLEGEGGDIELAYRMGLLIRTQGWSTLAWRSHLISPGCGSACALAFLGGVARYANGDIDHNDGRLDIGRVGFHQMTRYLSDGSSECVAEPADPANQVLLAYYERMVGEGAWTLMASTLHNDCRLPCHPIPKADVELRAVVNRGDYTQAVYERFK